MIAWAAPTLHLLTSHPRPRIIVSRSVKIVFVMHWNASMAFKSAAWSVAARGKGRRRRLLNI
jgi:hypothetical protein